MPNPGLATCGVIMVWVGGFGGGEKIGGRLAERGGGVVLGRAVVDRR